jgi:hypothetical protein
MRIASFFKFTVLLCVPVLSTSLNGTEAVSDRPLEYVLSRYIENMGGRATLEQIKSLRMSGTITYKDGQKHKITVLKKKPNRTRVVVDAGIMRMIQAYDGETAWFAREIGKSISYSRMEGKMREVFVRESPLENILFHPSSAEVTIELAEDVEVAMQPCYQLVARFADGSRNIFYIDKKSYMERRILEYNPAGEQLSELVPGKFETYDGVVFAMQIIRLEEGEIISTLQFSGLETNVGILDTAFIPPVDLP